MKECEIVNEKFSWVLFVDGQEIPFQYSSNVKYFKSHYESLGYKVTITDNRNN